jgi:hypothetical protein
MATPGQGRIEHRLAAILAADVAGRLKGDQEAGAPAGYRPPIQDAGRERWHFRSGT